MLAKLTVLSTFGSPYYEAVESLLGFDASESCMVNTDNIGPIKATGSSDSIFSYKLNLNDDRSPEFKLKVDETKAAIILLADVSPNSNLITLPVYEGALTFSDVAELSTTDISFNVPSIVWGTENIAGTVTRILVCEGGFTTKIFYVDYSISQLLDIAETGTTTTTTSSTSSTSTSSTSTTTGA